MTEDEAKSQMRSSNLFPWTKAQSSYQQSTAGMYREVTRLDNRIDEIIFGNELVNLATFSTSGTWTKPPGATRVVVNVIAGASGGACANSAGSGEFRGGLGGYSGGWYRATILAGDLPDTVEVTVGSGSDGATTSGWAVAAGDSAFGTYVVANGSTGSNYGSGNYSFRVRGGDGGYGTGSRLNGVTMHSATYGGAGSYNPGGEAGAPDGSGNPGVNGYSITEVGKIGMGSGGGGGAMNSSTSGGGGRGGDGGWPSGPGGGGGGYNLGGPSGRGGKGAAGAVFVMTYLEDTLGVAPSAPTNLTASEITPTTAKITWTASTDDIAVRNYKVFVDGTEVAAVDGISHTVDGLSPATTYQITVRAVDLGGNVSNASAPLSLTTTV
ncbi:fibronectin type III domain-containing protein [Rhodococcus sp. A5(2022)]|uniref:fibronectin type III domain-containing protein n=1 Tax=Rhodococcus sp. A5(2022) TaxID=3003588 RepID=UPI0022A836A7|nr:fibronectin type III domain-containing protein [Rhodococcus sp. A5(2022)]MCZ1070836.1 fibronectin type III domain-containing protein [Rhodococcus sp. A5(2022)]